MKKILSIGTKEILSGISQDDQIVSGGVWYTVDGLNPYTSRNLGTITFTQAPTEIGSISGDATSMTFDGSNGYVYSSDGSMYKISSSFSTPSISNIRTAASISSPAVGIELFQSMTGSKYLYYWQASQIGRFDLAGTYPTGFTDNWHTITSSTAHPTLRIDDRIFFGSGNYVEYLYDNGVDADVVTEALDLPKEYTITALATDGEYLIIAASKNAGALNSYNETAIVYWDWKNNLSSWDRIHYIKDERIYSLQTVDGVQYALGSRGTYVYNISTPPKLVRKDIVASTGYPQIGGTYNGSLTFATGSKIGFYGKTIPNIDTAYFKLVVDPANKTIDCIRTDVASDRIFYCSDKVYYVNPQSASTSYGSLLFSSISTAYFNLDNFYNIKRIDFVFTGLLASGDSVAAITLNGHGGKDISTEFTPFSFTNFGAVSSLSVMPVAEDFEGDEFSIAITTLFGAFKIKRIDFYGEPINR
jgi:hypothetical protein